MVTANGKNPTIPWGEAPKTEEWGVDWRSAKLPIEDKRPGHVIAAADPFLTWIATHHRSGLDIRKDREIHLSKTVAARFAIRVENDGVITLGVNADEYLQFAAPSWKLAALMSRRRSSDMICLKSSAEQPINLMIPIASHLVDRLEEVDTNIMRIRAFKARGTKIFVKKGPPELEIPFMKIPLPQPSAGELVR